MYIGVTGFVVPDLRMRWLKAATRDVRGALDHDKHAATDQSLCPGGVLKESASLVVSLRDDKEDFGTFYLYPEPLIL